jgi:uroporphyrinogen-III decarboxylase
MPTAMTSRQRVLRALEFDTPDRPPRDMWLLPGFAMQQGPRAVEQMQADFPVDIAQLSAGKPKARRAQGDPYAAGQSTDEWGCVFQNIQPGIHGEVKDPLIGEWSDLDRVSPPTELYQLDLETYNAAVAASDRFILAGGWARLFERMQFLRGSENLYMDLIAEPEYVRALLEIVHEHNLRLFEVWSRSDADAQVIMDDWGSQQALLIDPEMWRQWFKPCYAEYCRIARQAGKKVFMHSDGHISAIYEDLIEIGVDAINSQLFCMDIEQIGRDFAGRITFWGEIDRQHVLARAGVEQTRQAVQRVYNALWRPEGGVIAQCELALGTKPENARAVYETWDALTAE